MKSDELGEIVWGEMHAAWGGKSRAVREKRIFELMAKDQIGTPNRRGSELVVTFSELTEAEAVEYLYLHGFTKDFFVRNAGSLQKLVGMVYAHPVGSAVH